MGNRAREKVNIDNTFKPCFTAKPRNYLVAIKRCGIKRAIFLIKILQRVCVPVGMNQREGTTVIL